MLATFLSSRVANYPDHVAVLTPCGRSLTFADVEALADRVRPLLPASPSRVGVRLANDPASVAAVHAVWGGGHCLVAIGAAVPDDEAARRLADVGAAAYIGPHETAPSATRLAAAPGGDARDALILFTSGTTGRPKAAALSARAVLGSATGIAVGAGAPADGRPSTEPPRAPRVVFVPLAHAGGILGTVTSWFLGVPLLLAPRFSADLAFDLAARFRLGAVGLTPAMVYDLAHADGDRSLPGITTVGCGTAALPETTARRFEDRYGIPILRNYGQTEFIGAIAYERYADVKAGVRPDGSVGRIAPGIEVSIRDGDGVEVALGETGEIWAKGPSQMRGYLDADGRPQAAPADGFIGTGDLGFVHDGDFLTVVGRSRDVIICGGFNINPGQVEAALNALPGVAESVVAALADERLGEVPVALVVGDGTQTIDGESLRTALRATMAAYELPRQVDVVATLPRTANGKLDRPAVAAHFEAS